MVKEIVPLPPRSKTDYNPAHPNNYLVSKRKLNKTTGNLDIESDKQEIPTCQASFDWNAASGEDAFRRRANLG